ncbi:uncharacterized protein LOC135122006 isoform X2 [Zophobas morio]|uniref:uncharacterized protein LOC135122006 isoform X2 n=1 Tax=Zophobas morio TaxID=2755281 RepID=UPI003083327D
MRKGRRKIKVEGELLPLQPLEVNELLLVENQGLAKGTLGIDGSKQTVLNQSTPKQSRENHGGFGVNDFSGCNTETSKLNIAFKTCKDVWSTQEVFLTKNDDSLALKKGAYSEKPVRIKERPKLKDINFTSASSPLLTGDSPQRVILRLRDIAVSPRSKLEATSKKKLEPLTEKVLHVKVQHKGEIILSKTTEWAPEKAFYNVIDDARIEVDKDFSLCVEASTQAKAKTSCTIGANKKNRSLFGLNFFSRKKKKIATSKNESEFVEDWGTICVGLSDFTISRENSLVAHSENSLMAMSMNCEFFTLKPERYHEDYLHMKRDTGAWSLYYAVLGGHCFNMYMDEYKKHGNPCYSIDLLSCKDGQVLPADDCYRAHAFKLTTSKLTFYFCAENWLFALRECLKDAREWEGSNTG